MIKIQIINHIFLNKCVMTDPRYKKYEDCNLEELEQIVEDLENMSISALKSKKIDIRRSILGAVKEAKLVIEKRLKK